MREASFASVFDRQPPRHVRTVARCVRAIVDLLHYLPSNAATSFRFGENRAGSDERGGERKDIMIDHVRNENVKYGKN
jgi:hypothetical protein